MSQKFDGLADVYFINMYFVWLFCLAILSSFIVIIVVVVEVVFFSLVVVVVGVVVAVIINDVCA